MKHIRWLFSQEIVKFIIVGIINTGISMIVMLSLYNFAGTSDSFATLIAYIIGSIVSFILNRSFTFESNDNLIMSALRFTLNIALCYFVAYIMLKPATKAGLRFFVDDAKMVDNLAMLVGTVVFTSVNFIGQKYFAFRKGGKA